MNHVLVTNDFPPKLGGIQSYLYELWRRLPPESVTVLTTSHEGAAAWDAEQAFRVERVEESFLVPAPSLIGRIDALADEVGAELVLLDPAWPLGIIGPRLARPFGVVLHGAEVTVPARLPFVQLLLRSTLRQARLVVAAGGFPAQEGRTAAGRTIPTVVVPPGVDTSRFAVLDESARAAARASFGIDPDALVVLGVSRLVPRKGFDVAVQAAARLAEDFPGLRLVIAGDGRDRARLEQLADALHAPVQFLGRVPDADLAALYGCADIFAMLCRDRWLGLEQEGFGIVFLEAAACGIPSVAGRSGGSDEAVLDGETGLVVALPHSVDDAEEALATLADDRALRQRMGAAARTRAEAGFCYEILAAELGRAISSEVAAIRSTRALAAATPTPEAATDLATDVADDAGAAETHDVEADATVEVTAAATALPST